MAYAVILTGLFCHFRLNKQDANKLGAGFWLIFHASLSIISSFGDLHITDESLFAFFPYIYNSDTHKAARQEPTSISNQQHQNNRTGGNLMPMTGAPEGTRLTEQHTVDDGAEEVGWLETNSAGVDEEAMNNTQVMRKVCMSAHGH
jgi:hypothetical protein